MSWATVARKLLMKKLEDWLTELAQALLRAQASGAPAGGTRRPASAGARAEELRPLVQAQKRRAKKDVDWLLEARPEKQVERIRRARRLHHRPAVEELLRRSHEAASRDAALAARLASLGFELTLNLLDNLEPVGGLPGMADLQAHACAMLGNAARVACDFDLARRHFNAGRFHLGRGSGDALLRADILRLEASFLKDSRQPGQALRVLAEAERLYRELGEDHKRGKVLMKKAAVLGCEGDLEGALQAHRESVKALDPIHEPHLLLIELHNLAVTYGKLGRWPEARQVLEASEDDFQECPRLARGADRIFRLWTRARVAHGLGEREAAERTYLEARSLFAATPNPYDEALVALDLARLYSEQARLDDVARLAAEVLRALRTQPLEPEALAAVSLFVETARRREAAAAVIRATAQTIERFRRCPRRPS